MSTTRYGSAPKIIITDYHPRWEEFMHYQYLPVRIPRKERHTDDEVAAQWHVPPALRFMESVVGSCIQNAISHAPHLRNPYVYITARRGFATPGNPLNRPGWHCDDFGGTDLNYIWSDRYPTRALQTNKCEIDISEDDQVSMEQFRSIAMIADTPGVKSWRIRELDPWTVYRLDPFVIHDTPIIPAPGGMRSFFKISISNHRYDLLGNSHNYGLDYSWHMTPRATVRNQPYKPNRDYTK